MILGKPLIQEEYQSKKIFVTKIVLHKEVWTNISLCENTWSNIQYPHHSIQREDPIYLVQKWTLYTCPKECNLIHKVCSWSDISTCPFKLNYIINIMALWTYFSFTWHERLVDEIDVGHMILKVIWSWLCWEPLFFIGANTIGSRHGSIFHFCRELTSPHSSPWPITNL